MARKKDLAGLAALAGAAYLASRDKGDEAPVSEQVAAASPMAAETESEAADYGNEGRREGYGIGKAATAPAAAPRAATRPMGGSGRGGQGGASAEELAAYAASKKPSYESPYDRARREDREAGRDIGSVVEGLKNRIATAGERGRALPLKSTKADRNEFMGSGMKKGGSVKGWGAARGARKAKIY